MKLLFLGADIIPPWSEGRKKLVRDLAIRLQEIREVRLLTTGNETVVQEKPYSCLQKRVFSRWLRLHVLHSGLKTTLAEWQPDIVLHFPFSTFNGLRGKANEWSMRHIDRLCSSRGIRCLTIQYAVTSGPPRRLSRLVREAVLAPNREWQGLTMTMGTDLAPALRLIPRCHPKQTVLFMAGLQEATRQNFDYILQERGLADLIKASPEIARAGIRIIVAIPLLRDASLHEKLRRHFTVACPTVDLDLRAWISVPEIFAETDLYLFPYRTVRTQFIPTSVLEAMAAGVPVVLSDLPMFSPFLSGSVAYIFKAGDAEQLKAVILAALADRAGRQAMAVKARRYVVRHWSIDASMRDLMNIIENKVSGREVLSFPEGGR